MSNPGKWPKHFPPLSPEQQAISDDFMKTWHQVLPRRFGFVERFNQCYAVKHAPASFTRTLEIGAGLGEHLAYELLTPEQEANYYALEMRANMCEQLRRRWPRVRVVQADAQARLDFEDDFFDRVLAVHVLEHLPDLPAAVRETHRILKKATGVLSVVIPCEGSLAYSMARKIGGQRHFERRYKQSYKWLIEREHINLPHEVAEELAPYFEVRHRSFFPVPLPILAFNLFIGMTLTARPEAQPPPPAASGLR